MATSVPSSRASSVASRRSYHDDGDHYSLDGDQDDPEPSLPQLGDESTDAQLDHNDGEPEKDSLDYGGFQDEDESKEHEYAIKDSIQPKLETMEVNNLHFFWLDLEELAHMLSSVAGSPYHSPECSQ